MAAVNLHPRSQLWAGATAPIAGLSNGYRLRVLPVSSAATMRLAAADIDVKRQALEQVFLDVMSSAQDQTIVAHDGGTLAGHGL